MAETEVADIVGVCTTPTPAVPPLPPTETSRFPDQA